MKTTRYKDIKLIFTAILFVIAIISGILIHQDGKPYNDALFALHKLGALIAVILTIIASKRIIRTSGYTAKIKWIIIMVYFFMFLLFLSGALMSLNIGPHNILLLTHNLSTTIILALGVLLYIFIIRSSRSADNGEIEK